MEWRTEMKWQEKSSSFNGEENYMERASFTSANKKKERLMR
jgi:hypothetical protein